MANGLTFDNPLEDPGFLNPSNYGGGGGTDWMGLAGQGFNLAGSFADYTSGRDSAQDMADAYAATADQAQQDAIRSSELADPFQQYRPGFAQQLSGILTGETDFRTDPGYQFRMGEATRETERAGAARGFNRSGNIMAAVNQRAQDVASSEYNNIINRLSGLAGATPQNAIAGGQVFGNLMGNVYGANIASAANRSQAGGSSGLGGLLGGIGSMLGGGGGGVLSSIGSIF